MSLFVVSAIALPQGLSAQWTNVPSGSAAQAPSGTAQHPPSGAAQQPPDAAVQSGHAVTDQDIQMLRSDLRSKKKQIIAQNMTLTDAQAAKFWPMYDAYTQETIKLNDTRFALIKEYAQDYNTMTDAQASSLMKRQREVDQQFIQLRDAWTPKFEAIITPKQTARFFQLDRRIGLLTDLQLASKIPLVKE
jgi:hypothetical protein